MGTETPAPSAAEARQVRPDLDVELVLDLIYGPIFYRLTNGHAPIDARFTGALLGQLLEGIGPTDRGGDGQTG